MTKKEEIAEAFYKKKTHTSINRLYVPKRTLAPSTGLW